MRNKIKLSFSGHQTFALRNGWLKKVVDALSENNEISTGNIFNAEETIARFGVGKNMVEAMGFWAFACGLIGADKRKATNLGKYLFAQESGVDQYLEDEATLWLLHWQLSSNISICSTWYFCFHELARINFEKSHLKNAVNKYALDLQGREPNQTTLAKDIDCFINTYVIRKGKRGEVNEDSLECPLAELNLISETTTKGVYEYNIGPKNTLPDSIFIFALLDFYKRKAIADQSPNSGLSNTSSQSLFTSDLSQLPPVSLEEITYGIGSPGRAFKLDEVSLTERLVRIDEMSKGLFKWIDTAGLRQVQINNSPEDPIKILDQYFNKPNKKKIAA